ncbi:Hypothetical predicted protein [Mytilus galloprovincialis]|uniref:Uncharacterized protein n=1 Tax=Mytilus galloprovincialis TaxID=29158 RepID=A0A8B6E6Y6_MYTGA|nr:Hypothetical predicted protein [Mytilus galloprovincialis]
MSSRSVGGSYYSHSGADVDFLCMPPEPHYRKTTSHGQHAILYGGEFDKTFIPCAVCRKNKVSTVLMIPGKDTCYRGWNREYYGYLSHRGFAARTSFVCVHVHPEFIRGGGHNYDGKLLHPVIGSCGSLPCPPYVNNYPITCVVCSK